MKKKFYIFLFLTILVVGFIFYNSLQGPDDSNDTSGFFLRILKPLTDLIDKFITKVNWNFIVRKAAHFTEFCVLGLLSCITLHSLKLGIVNATLGYNLFFVMAVAVSDEFIQSFTGRTSSVRDVILDFTGALVGILAVIIFNNIKKRR